MESIATAILTAVFTVGLGLLAFEYQQKWNKKLALYEEIIERLIKVKDLSHQISFETKQNIENNISSHPKNDILREIDNEVRTINYRMPIYKLILPHDATKSLIALCSYYTKNAFEVMQEFEESGFAGNEIKFLETIEKQYKDMQIKIHKFTEKLITYVQSDLGTIQKIKKWTSYLK